MTRLSIWVAALAVATVAMVPSAAALPVYGGGMTFPAIADSSGPEDYSWEVTLYEGQELKSVDDQHAAVYYEDGEHVAFSITAEPAHDAGGANVPTSLGVSGGNVLTLTVHHRAGNPLAEGKSFDYPIVAGTGWIVIEQGQIVTDPLGESVLGVEERIRLASPAAQLPRMPSPPPRCRVPNLKARSLRASKRVLGNAHCTVGRVGMRRGATARTGRVVTQNPAPGTTIANGAAVSVVLAPRG